MLPNLKSERLVLRNPKYSDLMAFYHYAKKPNIGPNAGWFPHKDINDTKAILRGFIIDKQTWSITIIPYDIMVGSIGIYDVKKDATGKHCLIGFSLDDDYWNQGFMTEGLKLVLDYLFNNLNFDYIVSYHADFNEGSRHVILKSGFKFQYKRRKTFIANPKIFYVDYYRLTKGDYLDYEKRTNNQI